MKTTRSLAFVLLLNTLTFIPGWGSEISLSSPDGKFRVTLADKSEDSSFINYSVVYNGIRIIQSSKLGFTTTAGTGYSADLKIAGEKRSEVRKEWEPVYGEKNRILDHYNQTIVKFKSPDRRFPLSLTLRAYNEGIAFCYTFQGRSRSDSIILARELTEFRLAGNFSAWVANRAQAQYRKIPVSQITEAAERPLVVETGNGYTLALGEAKLIDFPRMKFVASHNDPNTLTARLEGEARLKLPGTTPWRYIMAAGSPGKLIENNFFILNLNDPCAIDDVSWIKPGKVIREITLTTQGGKACVDFAADNGLQYVEFDAGWYGPENNDSSDATGVHVDPARSAGPLDLQEVIEYARSKNIGIIVYVNRRALEKQLDIILPLYKSWGIKGVKYGFVQVGSQKWTAWLHEAVKKAARNQLMVDIHDEYRPTGFSRTYPNLLSQEGIRGDEESPSNNHTLITLFTRMIAGAGDNTNCYYAPRVREKMGGQVSQLAKAVMLYSPWQFIFWYDRPQASPGKKGGAGNSNGFIQNDKELDFYRILPTVWDETKVLEGSIGEYATLARKSGTDWFIGSLTAENPRELNLKLDFLESGSDYEATVYSNDPSLLTETKVKIENRKVAAQSSLKYSLAPNSGLAVYIKKINR